MPIRVPNLLMSFVTDASSTVGSDTKTPLKTPSRTAKTINDAGEPRAAIKVNANTPEIATQGAL